MKTWIKDYGKIVLEKIPAAQHDNFKEGWKKFAAFLIKRFDDLTIYTLSDYDMEGTLVFSYWKNESDEAPVFLYPLAGLGMIKV